MFVCLSVCFMLWNGPSSIILHSPVTELLYIKISQLFNTIILVNIFIQIFIIQPSHAGYFSLLDWKTRFIWKIGPGSFRGCEAGHCFHLLFSSFFFLCLLLLTSELPWTHHFYGQTNLHPEPNIFHHMNE